MFQRSITNKMRVKWALNPKALPTNFPHAAHRVGLTSHSLPPRVYSIYLLFTCIPCLPKLGAINVFERGRETRREREREILCMYVCRGAPRFSPTQADVWTVRFTQVYGPRRQVFVAWTLPLYTVIHVHVSDKRERSLVAYRGSAFLYHYIDR